MTREPHQSNPHRTARRIHGDPRTWKEKISLVLASAALLHLGLYVSCNPGYGIHSGPMGPWPVLAEPQDTEAVFHSNGPYDNPVPSPTVVHSRNHHDMKGEDGLTSKPAKFVPSRRSVPVKETSSVQSVNAENPKYIRQGEFAVLLLMAQGILPPAGGWNGESAACYLSGAIGCGEIPGNNPRKMPPLLAVRNGADETAPGDPDLSGEFAVALPSGIRPEDGWKTREFLTEGVLVELLKQVGIAMTTDNPESLVPWELASGVLAKFGTYLEPPENDLADPPSELLAVYLPSGHPGPPQVMSPSVP